MTKNSHNQLEEERKFIMNMGYISIYSAYLEEGVGELVDAAAPLLGNKATNIKRYQLASRAENLRKALKKAYDKVPNQKKSYDIVQVIKLLKDIEQTAEERSQMMHSMHISNDKGQLIQKTYSKKDPNSPPQEILFDPKKAKEAAEHLRDKIWALYCGTGYAKPAINELKKSLGIS